MNHFDDFSLVTKITQGELVHILESIHGSKELVVENTLMRPLDKIASMTILQEHNCLRVQQLHMDRAVYWDYNLDHRVFLIRPTVALAHKICELINSNPATQYSIIFVDRRRIFFENELEKNGLSGKVGLYEFNLTLLPLESDLFSMELPPTSGNVYRYETHYTARALWRLQSLYGMIPTSFCIGAASQEVDKLFRNLSALEGEPSATAEQPISHMFLFDRQIDIISPLLTCLTYESMLNDAFQYTCGKISFGETVEAKLKEKSNVKCKVFTLNNNDLIFSSIRNSHMTAVFPFLSAKAKELQSSFDRISGMKNIDDMKSFVANELKILREQKQQLEMHICACETILSSSSGTKDRFSLEQAIVQNLVNAQDVYKLVESLTKSETNAWSILQLVCLWSICMGGIPTKYFKSFQDLFLKTYGYSYLPAIYRLQIKNILIERVNTLPTFQSIVHGGKASTVQNPVPSSKNNTFLQSPSFSIVQASLKLCPSLEEQKNETTENVKSKILPSTFSLSSPSALMIKNERCQMSYVFSDSYVPVMCRLVEMTVNEGWSVPKLAKIFGDSVPIFCTNPSAPKPDNRIRKAIMVCFIGGVTFAEVAALRLFSQNSDFRLIVITTHIIQRANFMQNLAEV